MSDSEQQVYANLHVAPCSEFETDDGLQITNPTTEWFHVFVCKTTDPTQPQEQEDSQ